MPRVTSSKTRKMIFVVGDSLEVGFTPENLELYKPDGAPLDLTRDSTRMLWAEEWDVDTAYWKNDVVRIDDALYILKAEAVNPGDLAPNAVVGDPWGAPVRGTLQATTTDKFKEEATKTVEYGPDSDLDMNGWRAVVFGIDFVSSPLTDVVLHVVNGTTGAISFELYDLDGSERTAGLSAVISGGTVDKAINFLTSIGGDGNYVLVARILPTESGEAEFTLTGGTFTGPPAANPWNYLTGGIGLQGPEGPEGPDGPPGEDGTSFFDAWKGDWIAGAYSVGSVVRHTSGLYIATTAATSSDEPGVWPDWELMVQGV